MEDFFKQVGEQNLESNTRNNLDYYSDDEIDNYWTHYFDDESEIELEF